MFGAGEWIDPKWPPIHPRQRVGVILFTDGEHLPSIPCERWL
jgi:hypothetical protein